MSVLGHFRPINVPGKFCFGLNTCRDRRQRCGKVKFACFKDAVPCTEYFVMTKESPIPKGTKKQAKVAHPGMMGDGTEEQNLGERGNPAARIKKKEVVTAFGKKRPTK